MGKSSSSSKKLKRSKEDPSKLRSVKKKKKTKRSKSKKIRRIKDSSDESESDSSFYSSSSEDDYRREKRRSKVGKKKKRSRKRYSSSDSDDDDIRLLKKRSKKKDQHAVTKKKKKRRKRYSSSSSTSSDDNSDSDGMRMAREKGRLGKVNDGSEEDSEPDECWQVEDDVMTEKKNSKRLKSIIVVTYNYADGERKEDMVDDEPDENMIVDDQRDGEAPPASPTTGAHDNRRIGYDDFEEYNSSETSKASHPDNSLKDDDLEAILKKRALENLKRFRGEIQRNGKEVSSASEGVTLQTESEKFEESQEHLLMEQKLCLSERDKDLETSQVDNVKESGTGLADLPSQQSGDTANVKAGPGIRSCTTTKRKLIRPVLGQESLNLSNRKEADGCQDAEAESINGKSCPESSLALATKNGAENTEPRKVSSRSSSAETETLGDNKGESQSEQKTNDETKDESQYEQKTMTVMRGGEMVQVSYKVYIPKKTSSLGRRQLRR
ncbi:hypothetical protein N665_0191s0011 [Sinapis alba]|nr:hypothetical protein N665_0191s0011 [Sinapis alba]